MKKSLLLFCALATIWLPGLALGDGIKNPATVKRIVMILPELMFHDSEFTILKEIFEREKTDIVIASSKLSKAIGYAGLRVKPDIRIQDLDAGGIDAVVFIGGAGCLQYSSDYNARKLCKQIHRDNKILAAIHVAPRILAEFGLLDGRRVAASGAEVLVEKGVILTGKEVERDGNIITAYGPHVAEEFGELIISALKD